MDMRSSFFPVTIAVLVLLGAGSAAAWLFLDRERHFQKVEIPESYLETTDTSRYSVQPVLLTRNFPDDSILVLFPAGEERSQVFLYDQANYNRLLYGDHHGIPMSQPNSEGYRAVFGRPVLNMSGFPEGKYYVHVTGCNFGGFFQVEIADGEKK